MAHVGNASTFCNLYAVYFGDINRCLRTDGDLKVVVCQLSLHFT
jgi:hypothetical protein